MVDFSAPVTSKFYWWHRKTIGNLFHAPRSYVCHFIAIHELKIELPSGNAQIIAESSVFHPVWPWNLTNDLGKQLGTSSMLLQALCVISKPSVNSNWSYSPKTLNLGQNWQFLSSVTLKLDKWPWKTLGHRFYTTLSFVCHFKTISEFKLKLQSGNTQNWGFFVPLDLEIWRMTLTLKINRTPLLWPFKLCTSFRNHQWIQSYGPEMPKMGQNLFWCLWPLTSDLDFCMDITSANGNYTWKFHDDTMTGTLWKGGHRRTDGRTELFLKLLGRS